MRGRGRQKEWKLREENKYATKSFARSKLFSLVPLAAGQLPDRQSIATGKDGSVERISKLYKHRGNLAIRVDKLEGCVRGWKLEPSSEYTAVFGLGTTSETDYISLTGSKGGAIKLVLP